MRKKIISVSICVAFHQGYLSLCSIFTSPSAVTSEYVRVFSYAGHLFAVRHVYGGFQHSLIKDNLWRIQADNPPPQT